MNCLAALRRLLWRLLLLVELAVRLVAPVAQPGVLVELPEAQLVAQAVRLVAPVAQPGVLVVPRVAREALLAGPVVLQVELVVPRVAREVLLAAPERPGRHWHQGRSQPEQGEPRSQVLGPSPRGRPSPLLKASC